MARHVTCTSCNSNQCNGICRIASHNDDEMIDDVLVIATRLLITSDMRPMRFTDTQMSLAAIRQKNIYFLPKFSVKLTWFGYWMPSNDVSDCHHVALCGSWISVKNLGLWSPRLCIWIKEKNVENYVLVRLHSIRVCFLPANVVATPSIRIAGLYAKTLILFFATRVSCFHLHSKGGIFEFGYTSLSKWKIITRNNEWDKLHELISQYVCRWWLEFAIKYLDNHRLRPEWKKTTNEPRKMASAIHICVRITPRTQYSDRIRRKSIFLLATGNMYQKAAQTKNW